MDLSFFNRAKAGDGPNKTRTVSHNSIIVLAMGALGVVYGDIGTSPLYAIKECFSGSHAVALTEANIFGVISLVFWSLTFIVSFKYVVYILKADSHGEGGIFALFGLLRGKEGKMSASLRSATALAAIFGAALLYGDGVITPCISVLSAVEGLEIATKAAAPYVVPITCAILIFLFMNQHRGTGSIGKILGPIMMVWFLALSLLGAAEIWQNPGILLAVNPYYAVAFFKNGGFHAALVLASVVLCVTGAEALYADLGHFGIKAIRISWLGVACPALILNYLGQGALLMRAPEMAGNPFYGLVPRALLLPMVGLSTLATVIASQALISGVFSLTQQAIQLGYWPRLKIVHTSPEVRGQIYIPGVNYALMISCLALVLAFKNSSGLAGAYGIAVTATMGVTSMMYFLVATRVWGWSAWKAGVLVSVFLFFDLAFFGANLFKLLDGGWITLLIAGVVMIAMKTWKDGREELNQKMVTARLPLQNLLNDLKKHPIRRVQDTAVFMSVSVQGTPVALLHHIKHNHMLHERIIILSIQSLMDTPSVPPAERLTITHFEGGFSRVVASYGYMETPQIPEIMSLADRLGLAYEPMRTTYYLGRETILTSGPSKMAIWRKIFFAFMARNARNPAAYFKIPPNRVIEIGSQIEL
ncbi:MAG: potassium transporter Kup [Desulfobacula sp.]|jgi:KUP system potassium uptake protein